MTEIAKIFEDGESQVVALPKSYRFSDTEVCANKIGDAVVLTPKNRKWQGMLESLDMFSDDFMGDWRRNLKNESREEL